MKKISRKENVFIAKKYLIDSIYRSAKLEGIAVTFPQTEAVFYGGEVNGLKVDEIITINNLKHAWMFILDNLDYPLDYPYICKLNNIVGANLFPNPGFLRKGEVYIGGIDPDIWKPNIPNEEEYKNEISKMRLIEEPVERAVEIMLYSMRYQPFWDGNKRTSMLAANQILISEGCGILSINESKQTTFKEKLIDYYISNNNEEIKKFIIENAIECPQVEQEMMFDKLPEMDIKKAKESLLKKDTSKEILIDKKER